MDADVYLDKTLSGPGTIGASSMRGFPFSEVGSN